ncbi:hypothetical protein JOY44_05300 [Phormidium sp. CLA17]|uniref:hypothetical protein n=1 Tax=Leptolyngbya sp. Cla-17 TaxID=2803751 RepID=UPI0014912301|nr:hypothetical protein [Leptolyngbya sp. Cla-17]MBM0741038.1 hypothetical protein [Leptolyngbya sp. Cla-17]
MTIGEPKDIQKNEQPYRSRHGVNIQQSQETIYNFLLEIVKKWPPEEVLLEFKRLFIFHVDSISSGAIQAVYDIVFSNNQEDFRNTLKRACYILINNWDASRNYKPIRELIQLFCDPSFNRHTASPTLKRLRFWINEFVASKDFEELKLFTSRYEDQNKGPWSSRYTSYLLVPQYIDLKNPIEQREAARALSKQLKDRFKFDLAMFIARSQTRSTDVNSPSKNPTALGDEALRLIKMIVARKGQFSYVNIANIFLSQIDQLTFRGFKQSLQKYLTFSVENKVFADSIREKLNEKLEDLYSRHDEETVSTALILRTCNRVIDLLTTDNQTEPSLLFIQLLSQGNPVTLVIVFLKIILICKHSRTHLESRIAELIRYYQEYPESDCEWVVSFLEVFNVTFAIYAENVQYNLIKMQDKEVVKNPEKAFDPDTYRIFSQLKHIDKVELFSGTLPTEDLDLEDETID